MSKELTPQQRRAEYRRRSTKDWADKLGIPVPGTVEVGEETVTGTKIATITARLFLVYYAKLGDIYLGDVIRDSQGKYGVVYDLRDDNAIWIGGPSDFLPFDCINPSRWLNNKDIPDDWYIER